MINNGLKDAYPGVPILMTTPMEACRRVGRRRVPNANVATAARIICEAARDNNVACWDFHTAAGGQGAMSRWHGAGLANSDRIHLKPEGYTLQGDMLYDAFVRGFNNHLETAL